jgi:hypothetical protein
MIRWLWNLVFGPKPCFRWKPCRWKTIKELPCEPYFYVGPSERMPRGVLIVQECEACGAIRNHRAMPT